MAVFIFILIFVAVIVLVIKSSASGDTVEKKADSGVSESVCGLNGDEATFNDIRASDDERVYKIAGINFRGLKPRDIGYSDSFYIVPDKNNKYDRYAVAVFNDKQKHVGYLEELDNRFWFKLLLALKKKTGNPSLKCRGFVGRFRTPDNELKYFGKVFLLDALNDEDCKKLVAGEVR